MKWQGKIGTPAQEGMANPNPNPKKVTLYSCPTGGWLMGNRFELERSIKISCGKDVEVQHKVGCLLSSTIEVDGQSKQQIAPLAMILPGNYFGYFKASTTGAEAKALLDEAAKNDESIGKSPWTTQVLAQ